MSKGASFERAFCNSLSLWWTGGEREDCFWRTAGSGGRATARRKKNKDTKNHHGDVCATDPSAQPFLKVFALELKRGYASATLHDLLDAPEGAKQQTFAAWIEQAEASRANSGARYWLIVAKRDRRRALAVFPGQLLVDLLDAGHSWRESADVPLFRLEHANLWLVATHLDEFFAKVSPQAVRELAK